MALSRALYITFYILFLVTLGIALWFLLEYSEVPRWIWSFFAVGFIIIIIGVFIKEFFMKKVITTCGKVTNSGSTSIWSILYVIFHIIAFISIIIGIGFVIAYSTIPWWVWIILAIAIIFAVFGNMILALFPYGYVFSTILQIAALILFIVGIIFLVVYSDAPWWVWLLIGVAAFFAIMAALFEGISEPRDIYIDEETGCRVDMPVDCHNNNCNRDETLTAQIHNRSQYDRSQYTGLQDDTSECNKLQYNKPECNKTQYGVKVVRVDTPVDPTLLPSTEIPEQTL